VQPASNTSTDSYLLTDIHSCPINKYPCTADKYISTYNDPDGYADSHNDTLLPDNDPDSYPNI